MAYALNTVQRLQIAGYWTQHTEHRNIHLINILMSVIDYDLLILLALGIIYFIVFL